MTVFSKNLKRFRMAKHLTQEQAAEALGVSAQSISRWECGTTLPDVTILPQVARLYCITIDDLYKEESLAYDNYAQRLGSIYEATRKPDDFLRADQEYQKMMKAGAMTAEDYRLYGILYQYMMAECRDKALSLFDRVLRRGTAEDPETYWRTKRQQIYLYSQVGRGEEAIAEQRAAVDHDRGNANLWICLIAAYEHAGKYREAEECMKNALERFPYNACLCVYCGYVYADLKKYEDAFCHWEKALHIDPSFVDAQYSIGFCLEELGQYEKARDIWQKLAEDMEQKGFEIEANFPRTRENICAEKAKL